MFARLVKDIVVETIPFDPAGLYPSDMEWVACEADTPQGAKYNRAKRTFTPDASRVVISEGGEVDLPPAPEPEIAYRTTLTPPEFMLQFTSAERIGIRQARAYSGDAQGLQQARLIIDDWFSIIEDPRLTAVDMARADTQAGVRYLVGLEILTGERADEVLRGLPA